MRDPNSNGYPNIIKHKSDTSKRSISQPARYVFDCFRTRQHVNTSTRQHVPTHTKVTCFPKHCLYDCFTLRMILTYLAVCENLLHTGKIENIKVTHFFHNVTKEALRI